MKKIVIGLVVALCIVAPVAHGQTVDVSTMSSDQLRLYIITLIEKVIALENQLIAMQDASSSVPVAAPSPQIVATSTTVTQAAPPAISTPMEPRTISVSFALTGDDGYVTVKNDSGIAVRVKNLDVPGGLVAGVTIGTVYGQGFVYPASFTDSLGKQFAMFTCTGLGSLGQASLPSGPIDPCARRDASGLVKNELQPGETMIIRYVKSGEDAVSAPVYQAGSIVETGTGNDVTF